METPLKYFPDQYELVRILRQDEFRGEYIAREKKDDAYLFLQIYVLDEIANNEESKNIRRYARREVGLLEELKHPNILKLRDFNETRSYFWLSKQPAEITPLSENYSMLLKSPLSYRISLHKYMIFDKADNIEFHLLENYFRL